VRKYFYDGNNVFRYYQLKIKIKYFLLEYSSGKITLAQQIYNVSSEAGTK